MAKRLFEPISKLDFKKLQRLALKEHEAFFKRNPCLKKAVVGLFPDKIFGKIIWKGGLSR